MMLTFGEDSILARAILLALPAATLYILYSYLVEPLFVSPLRRVPTAHWSCAVSSAWIKYHRRGGSQALPALIKAHARNGPVIRLSPNEVSVASAEGAKKVYVERGGFAKPKWWAKVFSSYGVTNSGSMIGGHGDKMHAARRRDLGNVYSKSFVVNSDEVKAIAKELLADMCSLIDEKIEEENGVIDMYRVNGAVGADFMSQYVYGRTAGTRFLRSLPSLVRYYRYHDGWVKEREGPAKAQEALRWLEDQGLQFCNATERELTYQEKIDDAIVYRQLRSRGVAGKELASELLDHFMSGAEGPKTALTYLEWELSKNPSIQSRLREELPRGIGDLTSDLVAFESLPLLDAVLTETLRIYTPFPGAQHRVTPPDGTTIHGFFIPGGTQISASLGVLHRNPDVFENPEVWDPDRWLTDDHDKLEEMRKWFWAFNKGSRTCTGKEYILIVMKLVTAAIYSEYSTKIFNDADMEQEDLFAAAPVGERLVLRFRRV